MIYTNNSVRRQDRLLEDGAALNLLKEGEYGVLSLQSETDGAYGIPVSYVWDGDSVVYIHCAIEGRKLRCIEKCNKVSFCVVGVTRVLPADFTTEYESIVLAAKASVSTDDVERRYALSLLLDKYSPDDKQTGLKYMEKSLLRTNIVRLDIEFMSGKCKKIKS